MPPARAIPAHAAVIEVLQSAIESPNGKKVVCADPHAAYTFRMGLYSARTRLMREARKIYPPDDPRHGATPYDGLIFKCPRGSNEVLILKAEAVEFQMEDL